MIILAFRKLWSLYLSTTLQCINYVLRIYYIYLKTENTLSWITLTLCSFRSIEKKVTLNEENGWNTDFDSFGWVQSYNGMCIIMVGLFLHITEMEVRRKRIVKAWSGSFFSKYNPDNSWYRRTTPASFLFIPWDRYQNRICCSHIRICAKINSKHCREIYYLLNNYLLKINI